MALRSYGPDAPLLDAYRDILRTHGEKALFLDEVQHLALCAAGLRSRENPTGYPLGAFSFLVEAAGSDWPITVPIRERRGRSEWTNSRHVVDAEAKVRGVLDEWRCLRLLVQHGFQPIEDDRTGGYDWLVARHGRCVPIEVKGKAPIDRAYDSLHAYWEGLTLVPQNSGLRRYDWRWNGEVDEERLVFFSKHERMAALIEALLLWSADLSPWLAKRGFRVSCGTRVGGRGRRSGSRSRS